MSSAYTEQDLREAGKLHDRVHEAAALVSCPEGIEIGWAPEEAIPIIAAEFARIRSEARAWMREACAGHFPTEWHGPISGVCACSCGWHSSLKIPTWTDHIRSILDLAADEAIERIKAEATEKLTEAVRKAVIAVSDMNTPRSVAEKLLRAALSGKEPGHEGS